MITFIINLLKMDNRERYPYCDFPLIFEIEAEPLLVPGILRVFFFIIKIYDTIFGKV